ncbi:hypothetical protein [Streptomyces bohaiensis]|uniref:Uncharacterized protein n=1 Tax=Streptomyces bohaiensis TaxID=1431344 RepID=A0ABX1CBV3_9ACTN|nr:hypothetical protein [Streptomyces bohaiensis]NJQ15145.1 hypothetical protein [Streptomyces bohaiensis]
MTRADRPILPPVRLPDEAELAREALTSPLLSRAAQLAHWAESGVRVGAGGELLDADLVRAVAHLELSDDEDGPAATAEAWCFAVDTGLMEIEEDQGVDSDGVPDDGETAVGTARAGEELALLDGGTPSDVLEIWAGGLDAVLADAATPSFESLLSGMEGAVDDAGEIDPNSIDLDALDWDPEEEGEFLDTVLANLYMLTAGDTDVAEGAMVPLPVVAASLVVPDDMREPTDEVLEEVSTVMMRLDEQFRVLTGTGLLEYDPVDDALITMEGEPEAPPLPDDEEDLTRYGQVRLTTLGLYGVRERMLGAGLQVPTVGELAGEKAEVLLLALTDLPEPAAQAEATAWIAAREPQDAARELLDAARGDDPLAPGRRLTAQLALSVLGPEGEPALRGVLDDRHLGGLARVWLTERGAADVPPPSEELIFWLTVDTLAAQLDNEDPAGLQELVSGLSAQHSSFFEHAWQVDHPATTEVLEAVGRLHPDESLAKEARAAAERARSRTTD